MVDRIEIRTAGPLIAVGRRYELKFEDFGRIPAFASEAFPKIHEFLKACETRPSGPNVFEYQFHDNPHGKRRIVGGRFTLALAVPVLNAKVPPEPLELIELPAFKHVEIITNSFGDEWRRVRDLAEQAGFKRTLIEREVYLDWRGEGNPESKVALQVGIE
jgi:hypothetical protein